MHAWYERARHSEGVCAELLGRLLLEPPDLLEAFAPEGWERSPLRLVFNPTAEQLREERERIARNLTSWLGGTEAAEGREDRSPDGDAGRSPSAPSDSILDDGPPAEGDPGAGVLGDATSIPEEPEREVVELLGRTLWDIFSDNHTVVDSRGVAYDLGSFRGSGGFIAEALNERYPRSGGRYDYLDFYMGSALMGGRADLGPVYRWIFSRLRAAGCDWIFSFPRLHVVDLRGADVHVDDELGYDPGEAVRADLEEAEHRAELDALSRRLDEQHREAVRRAREEPLPATVAAYRDIFGVLPEGWPHADM